MSDPAAFLAARLDEDEMHAQKDLWAVARSTAQGDWSARYGHNLPQSYIAAPAESKTYIAEFTSHRASPPLADGEDDLHAADVLLAARMASGARRRAERMLREVEADRRLLHAYEDAAVWLAEYENPDSDYNFTPEDRAAKIPWYRGSVEALAAAIALRAAVYSGHPDYQQGWAS